MVDTPDLGSGTARCEGSTPFLGILWLLSCLLFGKIGASDQVIPYKPWYTGTVFAYTAENAEPGKAYLQLYFQDQWTSRILGGRSFDAVNTFTPWGLLQVGLFERLDLNILGGGWQSKRGGHQALSATDTEVAFGLQLLKEDYHQRPDLRLMVGAVFPTGKASGLSPFLHKVDGCGLGATRFNGSLILKKLFSLDGPHPFNISITNSFFFPTSAAIIKGINYFDGDLPKKAEVNLGVGYFGDLAFEWSITQSWVIGSDIAISYQAPAHFLGKSNGANWLLTFTPSLEYNISDDVGFLVAAILSPIGHGSLNAFGVVAGLSLTLP